jgi:hypothetical protein
MYVSQHCSCAIHSLEKKHPKCIRRRVQREIKIAIAGNEKQGNSTKRQRIHCRTLGRVGDKAIKRLQGTPSLDSPIFFVGPQLSTLNSIFPLYTTAEVQVEKLKTEGKLKVI